MLANPFSRFFSRPSPDDPAPLPHHGGGGLALVMPGGGARAAYQAGVVRGLARHVPALRPRILTGVSAGALNAAFLAASSTRSLRAAADDLVRTWEELSAEHVFRLDRPSVAGALARVARRGPLEEEPLAHGGLLDTTPLRNFVERHLGPCGAPAPGISRAIDEGHLHAFALTTTCYTTGESVTWVQGAAAEPWDRPGRRAVCTQIAPEHVLASSALPFFFPAVPIADAQLGAGWYGDGGVRLTAPLSPALHLGADRIIVINTRYGRSSEEAAAGGLMGYPSTGQVLGVLMNAVFLDVIDRDAQTLRRINALLGNVPPERRGGFRPVDLLVIRPSVDLSRLAEGYEARLPPSMRLLLGRMGEGRAPDWLSMLLFDPAYMRAVVEIGERDAAAQAEAVQAFLERPPGQLQR